MVRAWFIDNNSDCDKREELHRNPPKFIALKELLESTGVQYIKLNMETYQTDGILDDIKKDRGYTYEDELVCSKERLPNYEEKLKTFYTEHLHVDEEIRLCTEGCGFFDVRNENDEWIRIEIIPGDMLVLPKGIYHRFTLDKNNYVKVRRFFIGSPDWTAHNRPADNLACRKEYLTMFQNHSVEIA